MIKIVGHNINRDFIPNYGNKTYSNLYSIDIEIIYKTGDPASIFLECKIINCDFLVKTTSEQILHLSALLTDYLNTLPQLNLDNYEILSNYQRNVYLKEGLNRQQKKRLLFNDVHISLANKIERNGLRLEP